MLGRASVILAVVVFALAGLAWYLAAPRGELRLALDSSVQADAAESKVAAALFQLADSQVDDAQEYHARMSFRDPGGAGQLVAMPPTESPGGHTLQKLITSFIVQTSVDEETGRIALSIDGVALLEELYKFVGWTDYFLSITNIEDAPCADGNTAPCYRVFAHFYPSEERTKTFEGNVDTIAHDLAVLVMRGVVRGAGDRWQVDPGNASKPRPYVFAASVPDRMAALKAAADGIEILQAGTSHPECQRLSPVQCLQEARSLFERAIDEKRGGVRDNPVAAFGLSLVATQQGLDAASALRPDREVEAKLQEAERLMRRALTGSGFLREKLADGAFTGGLGALQLQGLVLDEEFYKTVGRFVCSLDSYRQGDWEGCLGEIGTVEDYPAPLRRYLEAARSYASLMHFEGSDERRATIEEIRQRLAEIDDDANLRAREKRVHKWPFLRVLVLNACIHPEDITAEAFLVDAKDYVNNAPDFDARWIAKVDIAGCRIGEVVAPDDVVPSVGELVDALNDDEARHRLELALAKYYVRNGDFDSALPLLKNAIRLPYVGPYVRSAPEFQAFMASGQPADEFVDAYYALLPELGDQEECWDAET